MTEQKNNSDQKEIDAEELFREHPEVVSLKAKLDGMSKDILKKTTDSFRAEISQLSSNISQLKKKREEANAEARHYRTMRNNVSDEKFATIEKLREQANKEKEQRDQCNEQIKINKEKREKLKIEIKEAWEKVKELRERYYRMKEEVGVMPDDLTEEIRELEWKQQTSSLSPEEDVALTKRIAELYEKAYTAHLIGYSSDDLEKSIEHAKKLSLEHDEAHEKVVQNAEEGQKHHEQLQRLYAEIDKLRSGGNTLHDRFLAAREMADVSHQKIVELYEQIKLKQYLLDLIEEDQARRRFDISQQLKEERKKETESKKSSSKRLTFEELRLLMSNDEEETDEDDD
ncbi:MAG: coiled-coil protein [Candidatus Thorarchaeota archaeon]